MLTESGCRDRRRLLWEQIPEELEWLLVGDPRHVLYLSGFHINPVSFSLGQPALLLLLRSGKTLLLADNFSKRSATAPYFTDDEIIVPWYTHRRSVVSRHEALAQAVAEARPYWGGRTGLIEPEGLTEMLAAMVADDAAWQFSPEEDAPPVTLGELLRSLRRSKHPDEVALLERCSRACEAGHHAALNFIQPGISELDVFLAVQRAAQEQAGEPCVVYGDFRATNPTLPKAGGLPTSYRLQTGDLFILDYSVILQGYRCDFTNTIAVDSPTAAANARFAACTSALAAAEKLLLPGNAGRNIWKAASDALEQAGCGPLTHHAGHGIGMEHPELPILVSESNDTLQTGDVVTLEPGCYLPDTGGIRIEHNYLITESGFRRLSQHQLRLQR